MPLRMEAGSSGITLLRDLEVLWLGVLMLPAGFSARMVCKCILFLLRLHPEKIRTEKHFRHSVTKLFRKDTQLKNNTSLLIDLITLIKNNT